MPDVDWSIEGVEFGNCNCDYGCPCQFESKPTHGTCFGFEALRIDKGHFADIKLDGLMAALLYRWPGPIYEGNGEMQAVIDERADDRQRDALSTVLHGGETVDEATHWWVYHAMCSTVHPPVVAPIDFTVDLDARRARVEIPGLVSSTGRPIKSPATGAEHRVRIDMPDGIEFEIAEVGSASTQATAAIAFELNDSYGQFNVIRHSGRGFAH